MHQTDFAERDYQRVEVALRFLAAHYKNQPDLAEIAASVHLSEAHLQRLFTRWAGVSPKQFLQYLTLDHARQCLQTDMSVLDTTFDSGLSAPARLNELFVRLESVTPAEFKHQGRGIQIDYGFHQTPFGLSLIGMTDRGLSGLEFCLTEEKETSLEAMIQRLPAANYQHNPTRTEKTANQIFNEFSKKRPRKTNVSTLPILIKGTPFQLKVWEALLRIPPGSRVSYKHIAASVGSHGANQAVGSAVGKNPVALLIPCHRVIREDGLLGGYRWGLERKLAILGHESAQQHLRQ